MSETTLGILLVEEQETHAELMCRAFDKHGNGFGVMVAGTLQEARGYLKKSPPDLVITKVLMPDGKWTDLLHSEEQDSEGFPVVVMTNEKDENCAMEAMKAGALDCVVKSRANLREMPHIAERALREWEHIIKHRRADKALRESQEHYRSIMEAMNDLVYISSPEYRIIYMNPAMIERTGHNASGEACYEAIHGLNERCGWCVHDRVQQGERCETEVVSPKDRRPYHVCHSPIFHVDGSVSQMTVCKDISELKRAEEERLIKEKLEGVLEMAGAACHELNQPLMTISGYCELLMMVMKEDDPYYERIKVIDEQVHRMGEITGKIMNIRKYETTKYLDKKIIDIDKASEKS
jgi:PAS domain S-box-containing protein